MRHKEIQLLMSSYLDGEVSESEKLMLLEHLDVCAECRQFVKDAGEMREEIRTFGGVELSYAFAERIAHLASKSNEQAKDWLSIEPLARNTFLVIAVIVLVMFLLTSFNKGVPPGVTEVLINGSDKDSAATQVLLHPGYLSKNDLLFAVMTK
jgi:predicted anti-sigma-YlaC factor YlaD